MKLTVKVSGSSRGGLRSQISDFVDQLQDEPGDAGTFPTMIDTGVYLPRAKPTAFAVDSRGCLLQACRTHSAEITVGRWNVWTIQVMEQLATNKIEYIKGQ